MKPHNLPKLSFLVVATALWVSACSLGNPAATEAPPPPSATAPESTPTALVPLVIRLAAEDAEPGLQVQVDQIVQTFAAEGGYRFEMRQALTAADLPPETEIVVILGAFPGAGELVSAAADVRFIAIGAEGLSESANLQSMAVGGGSAVNLAFVAGYMAATATDDWRVGILYGAASTGLSEAFLAGARYFCGSCVPVAPPYEEYPLARQAEPANWQAAADELLSLGVSTVYLAPELETAEIAQYLADRGVRLIGNTAPPAGLEASWLASIGGDASQALQPLAALLAGEQPPEDGSIGGLSHLNEAVFGSAQQDTVRLLLADLAAGLVSWETE